jgi:hypothetical protein
LIRKLREEGEEESDVLRDSDLERERERERARARLRTVFTGEAEHGLGFVVLLSV